MHALAALLVTITDLTAYTSLPVLIKNPDHYQPGTTLEIDPHAGSEHDLLMCTVRTGSAVFTAFPLNKTNYRNRQFTFHAAHADAWSAA